MSEARTRGLNQGKSSIFSTTPNPCPRPRDVPQSQSKIFEPLEARPRPMTFAREQYQRTTISLGRDSPVYSKESATKEVNSSPAGKKGNQSTSTKYLIGNDRSNFYKKSVSDYYGIPRDFEPSYSKESAFERKQKEFNDGYSPSKEEFLGKEELQFRSARDRKQQELASILDSNKYRHEVNDCPKENNKPPIYNPKHRKSEIMSSNVFGERTPHEYRSPTIIGENQDERRKYHLYSDLFGLESGKGREKPTERLQPTGHFLNTSSKPNHDYDPRDQSNKILSSNFDLGDSPKNPVRNRPCTPQYSYAPRYEDNLSFQSSSQRKQQELSTSHSPFQAVNKAEIYDLELSSVPNNIAANDIKDLCCGVHVVSLALDTDNFTGLGKGTGRLKLRSNEGKDLNRLEAVLKSKGIEVKEHQENIGRKSNYAEVSNVKWHNPYDYRRTTTPCGAKESKMKNLESNVFEGQKKWAGQQVESFDQQVMSQSQWKHTKNANRPKYY